MRENGMGLAHVEVAGFYKYCNKPSVSVRLNIDCTGGKMDSCAFGDKHLATTFKNAMNL